MAQVDTVAPYALTTRSKVKSQLGIDITDTTRDLMIDDMIGQVSMMLQNLCNRNFLQQAYTEMYDTDKGEFLFLRQLPIAQTPAPIVSIRGGAIDNPTWTVFLPSGYYIYHTGGYLRFAGLLPRNGRQLFQVQYTAGYLINFTDQYNTSVHTLPLDLTAVATDLVTKAFNQRSAHGFTLEMLEGQRQEYNFNVEPFHQQIISKYSKPRVAI